MSHAICGAHARSTGEPCQRPAGWGTSHRGFGNCSYHGGRSPSGERYAQRLAARDAAQAFGVAVEVDPVEALEGELWRTAGHVMWLGEHLRSVPAERRLSGEMSAFAELYAQERRHLTAVAKSCVDVGLDERKVAVLERTAEQFAAVLRRVLADLDVLDDPRAPAVVQRHLALLDAPSDG